MSEQNPILRYVVCDIHTHYKVGELKLRNVVMTDPLRGAGELNGFVFIRDAETGRRLKSFTQPDTVALYCVYEDTVLWGGPLIDRNWNPNDRTLTFVAHQWESWLYSSRLITPETVNLATRDRIFRFTQVEQFHIVRDLIRYAMEDVLDTPNIPVEVPATLSGKKRDASWESLSFQEVGKAIDTVCRREGGFDWAIEYRRELSGASERIRPFINLYYPERQSRGDYRIKLYRTSEDGHVDGNILSYDWPESASGRKSRQWATSTTEQPPPNQLANRATATYHGSNKFLYREGKLAYNDIKNLDTLGAHARRELNLAQFLTSTVDVTVSAHRPKLTSYLVGDRVRLRVQDEWVDETLPAVRIVGRSINAPYPHTFEATLSLDLTDAYGPLVEVE